VLADRSYDHDKYRRLVWDLGVKPLIARRGTEHGSGLGTQRWVAERAFAHLHWFRRLRIRWEIQSTGPVLQIARRKGHGQSTADEAARDQDLCVELVVKMQHTRRPTPQHTHPKAVVTIRDADQFHRATPALPAVAHQGSWC
jgi:transposase